MSQSSLKTSIGRLVAVVLLLAGPTFVIRTLLQHPPMPPQTLFLQCAAVLLMTGFSGGLIARKVIER